MKETTTTTTTTETQNSNKRNSLLSTHQIDKKKTMKTLSLRPSRSVKKNSSVMPQLLKKR